MSRQGTVKVSILSQVGKMIPADSQSEFLVRYCSKIQPNKVYIASLQYCLKTFLLDKVEVLYFVQDSNDQLYKCFQCGHHWVSFSSLLQCKYIRQHNYQ